MVIVAGFGNPLLDLTVSISDDALLKKYNIAPNEQIELSNHQMMNLIEDIQHLCPKLTPGGSTQNTMRVLQWLLSKPHSTIMYGSVGCDKHGKLLKELVEKSGVETRYIQKPNQRTGISVALIKTEMRTLLAYIGAAQYVDLSDFKDDAFLNRIDLVYMEAYFLTLRIPVAKYIEETCGKAKIPFVFNLSAIYMVRMFTNDILYFAEKCDILIGNYKEYEALMKALNFQDELNLFVLNLCTKYTNTKGLKYRKTVVITNESKDVVCLHSNDKFEKENVINLTPDEVVDTNGAGDAFAAGFLYAYLKERTPKECLHWGCLIASEIIQQTGCTIPKVRPKMVDLL